MEIRTFPVGSYQTNCYIVWGDDTDSCVVIDPGYEPEYLLEQVRCLGKKLQAILLTHGHFDHVGGVKALAQQTGCRVYICKEDLALKPALTAGAILYTDTYSEGDVLELAGLRFQVLHTPGHTPGSVCLVCGDTIFPATPSLPVLAAEQICPAATCCRSSVLWRVWRSWRGITGCCPVTERTPPWMQSVGATPFCSAYDGNYTAWT